MKTNYILALSAALLLWLAWPPIPYTGVLLWFAFVPLLIAFERIIRSDLPKKGKKIFLTGGLTALIWNTACIYWVYNSVSEVMPVYAAIPISMIPFGLGALLMTLAFRAYYQLRKHHNIYLSLLGMVGFWISYEYLHQTWDLAFPWMTLGNGFASTSRLIQWYEYTGVYGGTIWIWGANAFAFLLYLAYKDKFASRFRTSLGLYLAAWIGIPAALSLLLYANYEENINPSEVVVVQPNVEPYGKFGPIPPSNRSKPSFNFQKLSRKQTPNLLSGPKQPSHIILGIMKMNFGITPYFTVCSNFWNPTKMPASYLE